ncbi:MAG TPA: response regulator, partial [Methylomirabilota bacterium]|nr:response regulator [Methylomirabilota bacterium]
LDEVARVAPRDEVRRAPAAAPAAAPVLPAAPGAAGLAGPVRVLVVDDSPTIIQVLKYFLELEGYEVLSAPDGEQGLATAREARPHVVVSDVDMPRLNGIGMVKALRADPLTSEIPILLLSAQTSVESEAEGLAVGADDYVPKPVEPRRLAARVKALLGRTQKRWQAGPLPAPGAAAEAEVGVADAEQEATAEAREDLP